MTLLEAVTGWMHQQCNKHNLDPDGPESFARGQVNDMSNYELLCVISEALEEAGYDLTKASPNGS